MHVNCHADEFVCFVFARQPIMQQRRCLKYVIISHKLDYWAEKYPYNFFLTTLNNYRIVPIRLTTYIDTCTIVHHV